MNRPIGIFDSGIGGLTVARAVKDLLPREQVIYFGDTAHLPYGDKSAATIQGYARQICDVLLERGCKLILIACNSASAAAYDTICRHVGQDAHVLNVIDPMVQHLGQHYAHKTIGLIGTQQTVQSDVYAKKIAALDQGIQLRSLATPLLAPMIEAGFIQGTVTQEIIHSYLEDPALKDIEALVLGCTHYPLIHPQLNAFYQGQIPLLDAAQLTAQALQQQLVQQQQLHQGPAVQDFFLVSDLTPAFVATAQSFFHQPVLLQQLAL